MKQFTKHKTWLLLVGALLFALLFFYKLKVFVSDGSGLKDFYFKIDVTLDKHQDVTFYSPLNSEIALKRNDLNIYSFNAGKTAVSTIKIKGTDIGSDFYVKNAITDDWIKIDKSQISVENSVIIIKPPTSSTSFLPYFNKVFNWYGDFYMMAFVLIEQLLILLIVSCIYKYRTIIPSALNALKVDFFETNGFTYVIFFVVLSIGFLLNIQNSTYLEMSFRHPDEVVIINPIFFNPLQFWNGIYDSQYNLLQVLFSLPGLLINDYRWVAVGNRMISTVFAGLSVVYVYKIIGLFCKHYWQNILLILLLLTIPGFWINLNIARPDWVMTGALIVSFYFLIKDRNHLKINFWLSVVFFAYACAIKFHSIQYLPVFAVFWLINFGNKKKWRLLLNMLLLFTVSFFVLNFEYLSLNNLKRFVFSVIWQLEGNATGYGSSKFIHIPLSNKIHTLKIIYAHIFLLAIILMSHFYLIFKGFKNLKYKSLCALAIGNILVIVYNLFLVNKNWYNYYLTFLIVGFVLLFISILLLFNKRNKMIVVLSLMFVGLQIYSYNKTYFDIKNDYLMSKIGEEEYQIQIEGWDQIAVILKENPKKEISVLKSMYIAFDYLDIKNNKNISTVDIGAKNLDLIYNKDVNYITSFDFIIVRKYPESHINYILTENIESVLNQKNSEMLFQNGLTRVYRIMK